MNAIRSRQTRVAVLAAAFLACGYSAVTEGTTYTWTPNVALASNNWNVATNWSSGTVPPTAPTDPDVTDLLFAGSYGLAVTSTQNSGSMTVNSITFGSTSFTSGSATLSISGSGTDASIYLGAGGIVGNATGSISMTAGTGRKIVLTANQSWSNSNTAAIVSIRREIEGAFQITKTGAGTLELQGANTLWTGGLNLQEGVVRTSAQATALGAGTITAITDNFTALNASGSAQVDQVVNGQVVLGGAGTFSLQGSWKITLANTVTLQNDKIVASGGVSSPAGNREITGQIVGPGGFFKGGGGTLVLSNASNTYEGNTKVLQGVLQVGSFGQLGTGTMITFGDALGTSVGTLYLSTADQTTSRNFVIDNGGGRLNFEGNLTITTPITSIGTGSFNKVAVGTLSVPSVNLQGGLGALTGTTVLTGSGSDADSSRARAITCGGVLGAWTSKLEVNKNSFVVAYGINPTPIATIADELKSGYALGSWNGNGITSAAAAAQSASLHKTALGYGESTDLGLTTFAGQTLTDGNVLIRYTWVGDADLDGKVNTLDFNRLAGGFGSGTTWTSGDFDYSGVVDSTDFDILVSNYGLSSAAPAPSLGSVVPEPATLSMLATGALLAVRRKRR